MRQRYGIIRFFFILIFFLIPALSRGEDSLVIKDVDTSSSFPDILLRLEMKDGLDLPLGGLTQDQLTILEDGIRIPGVELLPEQRAPQPAILVAIDSSRSINPVELAKSKTSAKALLSALPSGMPVSLISFDDRTVVLSSGPTSCQRLCSFIDGIELHGRKTLLFNSLYDAVDVLERTGQAKKVIVVYTDGRDEGSRVSESELAAFLSDTGVTLNAICSGRTAAACTSNLKHSSALSGGSIVPLSDIKAVNALHKSLLDSSRYSFALRFITRLSADGKPHRLEVRLRTSDLRLRTVTETRYLKPSFLSRMKNGIHLKLLLPLFLIIFFLIIFLVFFYIWRRKNTEEKESFNETPPGEDSQYYDDETDEIKNYLKAESVSVPETNTESPYASAWLMEKRGAELSGKIILETEEVTIGLDPGNTITVNAKGVSAFHAKIRRMDETYHLFDLVSETGTYLNGKKLLRPRILHDWDEIRLGKASFIFRGTRGPC